MLTVNLEKELIKQNKQLATPKELLEINEYEKVAMSEGAIEILKRAGLDQAITAGMYEKKRISKNEEQARLFNQDRVFHISQIEALCNKYYLRFLDTRYYQGSIDHDLHLKITQFELVHGVALNNPKIVAPVSAFKLEKKPKDPLLFHKINDEYYFLVAKWGNDLNIWNWCKARMAHWYVLPLTLTLISTALILAAFISLYLFPPSVLLIIITSISWIHNYIEHDFGSDECWSFYPDNVYDSPYID